MNSQVSDPFFFTPKKRKQLLTLYLIIYEQINDQHDKMTEWANGQQQDNEIMKVKDFEQITENGEWWNKFYFKPIITLDIGIWGLNKD